MENKTSQNDWFGNMHKSQLEEEQKVVVEETQPMELQQKTEALTEDVKQEVQPEIKVVKAKVSKKKK
jgi:hypothetical protein